MKKLILTLFALALALANQAFGRLVFQQEHVEHHAGLLEESSEAVFRFTNTGDTAVKILDVRSTCGCTVPKLEKKDYAPGESGEIRAVFTFGARVGTQMKRITVQTDAPGNLPHELNMVTHIPEWVVVDPRILRWTTNGLPTPQQFRVTVADPAKISIDTAAIDLRAFTVTREVASANVTVFTVMPRNIAERATEFLPINVTATESGTSRNRSFGVHCLVR